MPRARPVALALLVAALAAPAAPAAAPHPIRHDLGTDAAIAATGWALYVSAELAKERLAPSGCRVCGTNALDSGARERLVWDDLAPARHASDALAFGLFPAGLVAHQLLAARAAGDVEAGLVDLLVVAEAAAIAMTLNQATKFAVGRQRPFVRYRNFPEAERAPDADDDLSFFSGHTTFTFAVAAAAGTVSELRGYRSAPWVWAAGLGLAATTGYLRVAGDKHYLSDVLVGAAVGAAAGVALPRLLHPREADGEVARGPSARVTALPLGVVVVF